MWWLLVLGLAGLTACSSGGGAPRAERALPERIAVSSPAFAAGVAIPRRFTCEGENLSPPLGWSGVPTGTVEVALVVDDPDAPRGTYVHWVVVGIERRASRYSSFAYLQMRANGQDVRLRILDQRDRRVLVIELH